MILSPSTVRADLKCGKGAISKGEKCHKGTAQEVVEKVAPIALGLGLAAGAIALRRRAKRAENSTNERTVPRVPNTPPKPPKVTSPANREQAKAMAERLIERNKQRLRDNPQSIAYEMQADKVKRAAIKDVVNSQAFQDVFKSKVLSIEELADLARDPEAFRKEMLRKDAALTPSTVRADLKCGKGAISKGEKCTKGPATAANKKENNTIRNVAVGLGTAAVLGGALYSTHKYRAAHRAASAALPKNAKPEQGISRGRKVFKEFSGFTTGVEMAGAGLGLAGAGLMANELNKDPKKRNVAAMASGGALLYLGVGTFGGARRSRTILSEKQTEWESQAKEFKNQWYEARNAAQERARKNAETGSQGSRNVGSNKAVPEPFKDLGVSESASDVEIKKRWLQLMRENHPDAGGDPRRAQQINAAYQEILRRRNKLDSIFAEGFSIDWEALAL